MIYSSMILKRGWSLLEMLITLSIISLFFLGAFYYFNKITTSYAEDLNELNQQLRVQTGLNRFITETRHSQLISCAEDKVELRVYNLSATKNVTWGVKSGRFYRQYKTRHYYNLQDEPVNIVFKKLGPKLIELALMDKQYILCPRN